jgi:hypothetical protein
MGFEMTFKQILRLKFHRNFEMSSNAICDA